MKPSQMEMAQKVAELLHKLGISSEKFAAEPQKYLKLALSQLGKTVSGDV